MANFAFEGSGAAKCFLRFIADPDNDSFNTDLKLKAMAALEKARDLNAIPIFERAFLAGKTKPIRARALRALVAIGHDRSIAILQEILARSMLDSSGTVFDLSIMNDGPQVLSDIEKALDRWAS